MSLAVQQGKCFQTLECCSVLRHHQCMSLDVQQEAVSERQDVVVYRAARAQSKVVHRGSNAPENVSAMTQHAIGYSMRKHRATKAPKQVSECCCIQHLPSIAGISFPTIRALKTWHRNKKHQCMSVLGRPVAWTPPVHVTGCSTGKTLRNVRML